MSSQLSKRVTTQDFLPEYRALLQYLLTLNMAPLEDAEKMMESIFDKEIDIYSIIKIVNENIKRFDLRIVILSQELTGQSMCTLVSTTSQGVHDSFGFYSEVQHLYISKLIYQIIHSNDGSIGSIDALILSVSLKGKDRRNVKFNEQAADDTLKSLVENNVLILERGIYYLSPFAIASLEDSLFEGGATTCFFCKKIVIHGQKCESCNTKFHKYCVLNFFSKSDISRACPSCKESEIYQTQ